MKKPETRAGLEEWTEKELDMIVKWGQGNKEFEDDLKAYRQDQRREAAIEELRKIRQWEGTIFHDHIMNYCADRIEELVLQDGDTQ